MGVLDASDLRHMICLTLNSLIDSEESLPLPYLQSIKELRVSMPRKPSKTLTDGEHRIMDILWKHGSASVKAVATMLDDQDGAAYSTVQTMLRILEQKGYVEHHKDGRAFVYTPLVNRQQARASALKHVLARFFDGSRHALVENLLEDEEIDALELDQLKHLISRAENEDGKS